MSTTPTHRVPLCLEGLLRPGVWADRAACRNADTELFFATDDISVAAARRLCRPCPVRAQCADYALCLPDLTGIWGGMTETERRRRQPGATLTWISRLVLSHNR
jgi:WhiB family redox-sensing transcriptional regulator